MEELKRGRLNCPHCKVGLHWEQAYGMRMLTTVTPPKPKRPYEVYEGRCPECKEHFKVRK